MEMVRTRFVALALLLMLATALATASTVISAQIEARLP
jgi:hypothetical protein